MSASNNLAESPRVLQALDHPLNYTSSMFREVKPRNAEERLNYLYERRLIEDLLNEYSYRVDAMMVEPHDFKAYNNLFTDDCRVILHSGKRQGSEGLGEWFLPSVSVFHRMTHLSSNHVVKFESKVVAHGRSSLSSTRGYHPIDIGQAYCIGGYCYWSFRKVDDEWKISYLYLDAIWTNGKVPSAKIQ